MGKIHLFTPEQIIILDQIEKDSYLTSNFYFTGGTALSYFYLQHRYSEDLDFFSEKEFDREKIFTIVSEWANIHDFTFESQFKEVVYIFLLKFKNGEELKVDFGYYPHPRVEMGMQYESLEIDSLLDIAINKITTINQRTAIKDFVDLYFLLQKFSLWDLREGVRVKFRQKIEPFILAADLLKAEDFDVLPRMIKPLKLSELKTFFREKAKQIGSTAVE